jgi:hypothetical protein
MSVPDVSMAVRGAPHMGPVARGFVALGNAAERAVSQLAAVAADARQEPSRLGDAAALLTADGRIGSLWPASPARTESLFLSRGDASSDDGVRKDGNPRLSRRATLRP